MNNRLISITLAALAATGAIFGADDSRSLSINPTGMLLLDGGVFASPQKELFKDGVAIPDMSLGVKMSYGRWDARVDVGLSYNKVGIKDVFLAYNLSDESYIKAGNFVHHYGLSSATSANMKVTMESPVSEAIFDDVRQLGATFVYHPENFFATASIHAEPSASTVLLAPEQYTKEGYGIRSRLAWRPLHSDGKIAQVGFSGAFATPQRTLDNNETDIHNAFQFTGNFPTRVTRVTALDAQVDHAMNLWKFTPELLLGYGRMALETQYYFNRVNRRDGLPHYTAQGAYATVRGLLIGDSYSYNSGDAYISTPASKSLECVLSYNYTTLTDTGAGIYGGRMNDMSVTFNYYINKYMIARLRYSHTYAWDRSWADPTRLNTFMIRLQAIF